MSIIGNISPVNASQGDFTVNGDLDVTGKLFVTGVTELSGSVLLQGDLRVLGNTYTTEDNYVIDPITTVNYLSGAPVSGVETRYAGLEVDRGLLTNYQMVFDEDIDTFTIGEIGDLQPVATRELAPISGGFGFWNETEYRFETSSDFTTDTLFTFNDVTVANLSGALDPRYVLKDGDTMTGGLTIDSTLDVTSTTTLSNTTVISGSDLTIEDLNTGDRLLRTTSSGVVEESELSVSSAPFGGSGLTLAEYTSTPTPIPTGFVWVQSVDASTKAIKFFDGSSIYSVELGIE